MKKCMSILYIIFIIYVGIVGSTIFLIGFTRGNKCETKDLIRLVYPLIPIYQVGCFLGGTNE